MLKKKILVHRLDDEVEPQQRSKSVRFTRQSKFYFSI